MKESIDFSLHNLPMLLSANQEEDYQERIIQKSTVLLSFLIEKELLINIEPFDSEGNIKTDIIIRISNVTEEGLELFKSSIPKWFNYLDRGGKITNITRLERDLEKIRL